MIVNAKHHCECSFAELREALLLLVELKTGLNIDKAKVSDVSIQTQNLGAGEEAIAVKFTVTGAAT